MIRASGRRGGMDGAVFLGHEEPCPVPLPACWRLALWFDRGNASALSETRHVLETSRCTFLTVDHAGHPGHTSPPSGLSVLIARVTRTQLGGEA